MDTATFMLSSLFLHCPGKLGGFGSLTADADLHTDELGIGASGCEAKILFAVGEMPFTL